MKGLKIFLISFILLFALGIALAQETPAVEEAVDLDENIQPEDLGVSEPTFLPDSPFYFLKNWVREIQDFFAFNPVRKAELKMKFANEKLMEIKKLIELKRNPEIIKKSTENYQQEIEEIRNRVERIKEKAKENPNVESFLDKFVHQQTLHQKLLDRLENQVPQEVFEKIKEARERHLERFKDVMLKLEDRKEKISEKLEGILEKQKGSNFKEFKNLEVLKDLEEKVPEEAKEPIKQAQEKMMERLQERLEKMTPEKQEQLKDYLEKISGQKEKHLEILENIKARIQQAPLTPIRIELKEKLEEGKTKILERVEKKLEKLGCPHWTPPAPDFCKEGRIVVDERDPETGCLLPPKCIVPGEVETKILPPVRQVPPVPPKKTTSETPSACITLWDPVCGKDGRTYSNECFARVAGVEIVHKGVCEEIKKPIEEIPEKLPKSEMPFQEGCKNLCGDGICQEVVCLAIGCPCAETAETCPEDCK